MIQSLALSLLQNNHSLVHCSSHRIISVWTPSQYEDLKFNLYRSEFVNQGTVSFYNPSLPESIGGISKNGITMVPNNIRIGIGTTVQDTTIEFGNTVTQNGTTASGTLVG